MKRLMQLFVLAAFIFSCGGHWYVLQCIAWVNMIHEYAQVVPLPEAIGMTFSGQYPCSLCKAIAAKKESERLQFCTVEKYEKKFQPLFSMVPIDLLVSSVQYPEFSNSFQIRTEPPPTPPPRLA